MKSKRGNINPNHRAGEETGGLEKITGMVDQYRVPSDITPGEAWQQLEEKLRSAGTPEKRRIMILRTRGRKAIVNRTKADTSIRLSSRLSRIAAAAAILCILFTGYLMLYKFSTTVTVSRYGERLYVQLPDGSGVTLNAGSKISHKTYGWRKNREVSLDGEAFFEVTEGSRFTVVTGSARTRVLGTSFNVFERNREFRVKCSSGRIEVITKAGQHAILEPGEYLVGTNNRITGLSAESDKKINSWIRGEFYFHNEPLTNVFAEIERQFNITIDYRASESRSYSGYFNDKNLDAALNLVCTPMQLNYKYINDRQILIF
jgi:transmembrane sensor